MNPLPLPAVGATPFPVELQSQRETRQPFGGRRIAQTSEKPSANHTTSQGDFTWRSGLRTSIGRHFGRISTYRMQPCSRQLPLNSALVEAAPAPPAVRTQALHHRPWTHPQTHLSPLMTRPDAKLTHPLLFPLCSRRAFNLPLPPCLCPSFSLARSLWRRQSVSLPLALLSTLSTFGAQLDSLCKAMQFVAARSTVLQQYHPHDRSLPRRVRTICRQKTPRTRPVTCGRK